MLCNERERLGISKAKSFLAFFAIGVRTGEDTVVLTAQEVEVLVTKVVQRFTKAEEVEEEIVHTMCGRNCIEADNAGVRLFRAVGLRFPILVGFRFDRQLRRIDQAVAP